jgi:hypothetical protein
MDRFTQARTSRARDRALSRLGSITAGTAVLASAATIGFGGVAAATYAGSDDATLSVNADSTDPATAPDPTIVALGPGATAAPQVTTGLQPTLPPLATTRKKARVTSGGSH